MPKKVEIKDFRSLKYLNAWLGKKGKNHRIINIVPKDIFGTPTYDVYVEIDISQEEWYNDHVR